MPILGQGGRAGKGREGGRRGREGEEGRKEREGGGEGKEGRKEREGGIQSWGSITSVVPNIIHTAALFNFISAWAQSCA